MELTGNHGFPRTAEEVTERQEPLPTAWPSAPESTAALVRNWPDLKASVVIHETAAALKDIRLHDPPRKDPAVVLAIAPDSGGLG